MYLRKNRGRRFSLFLRTCATALVMALAFSGPSPAQKKPKLEKTYREWLERDVAYIITKEEHEDFLRLPTDDARDKFIEQFWEVRNPDPGSPTNSYKDEIYRRIAFANARFGVGSGAEGWRSDRGRAFITLGEPQQKQVYRNSANLYPLEIWFYANPNPALPRAFYVVFYQREGSGDYRFYSPYIDGPDKLVTGVEGINNNAAALKMIRDSVGPEVARISLSLLPDEPVDPTASPSLESDLLLAQIKGLANLPANREDIIRRRTMRESVTSRMLLEGSNLDIVTFPMRDSRGLTRLDYAIRLHNPAELAVTDLGDGNYRYSVEVRVAVFTSDNKSIFTQQKTITETVNKKNLDRLKERIFGYLGTLPLPPGKYHLDFQLTDWSKRSAYRTVRDIAVPAGNGNRDVLIVPAILPFYSAEEVDPGLSDLIPFASAGVKFNPMPASPLVLAPGTNLQVMYQMWGPRPNSKEYAGQKLEIEYALGKPAARGDVTRVKDELGMDQFDASGNIVTGKKLSLERQGPGNYLLTLTVNKAGSNERSFATVGFKVTDANQPLEPMDVQEPGITQDAESGLLDQERGLCHLAQGQTTEARVWFRRSLHLNPANDIARTRLVDAYFSLKDYRAVASLYSDAGITESTDSLTIVRIASSLNEIGKTDSAISLLETALRSRPKDGPLYLALAGYYGQTGNAEKAADLTRKGKSYLTAPDQNLRDN